MELPVRLHWAEVKLFPLRLTEQADKVESTNALVKLTVTSKSVLNVDVALICIRYCELGDLAVLGEVEVEVSVKLTV